MSLANIRRCNDGSRDIDSFQLQQRHRSKYEVNAGYIYIFLVLGWLGGSVGKVYYCSFATNINQRILHEEDDHDFGENQNPIMVQLHSDEPSKMEIMSCYSSSSWRQCWCLYSGRLHDGVAQQDLLRFREGYGC